MTSEILERHAYRFSLNEGHELDYQSKEKWLKWIGNNQFVGIAEVHNSVQLSYFTKALLSILAERDFRHFAMEMGPATAKILSNALSDSYVALDTIEAINRRYGKKSSFKTPLIFANKVQDIIFLEAAKQSGYSFWGLDQEFAGSYEMLLDNLYVRYQSKSPEFDKAYIEAKKSIRELIFKNKKKGRTIYSWYIWDEKIDHFFDFFEDSLSLKLIEDIKISWDIYEKNATGKNSNQQRADLMKRYFEQYLVHYGNDSKVVLKLGGVHLTHGLSPFGTDDMGKYLTEKANQNNTGYLSIRHLIPYRNGKSNVGKSSWQDVSQLLELGRKDQWTVIDLRPIRAMLDRGEITVSKNLLHELRSYDLVLLTPDDQYPKVNY